MSVSHQVSLEPMVHHYDIPLFADLGTWQFIEVQDDIHALMDVSEDCKDDERTSNSED